MNSFESLDAQSAESAFAKLTPEENAEFESWCDARLAEFIQSQCAETGE